MTKAATLLVGAALALVGSASASVVISNGNTKHMSCSAGICVPTAKNAVLNAGDLQTMLASSDVTVKTGAGAVAISIASPLTWGNSTRLTLAAQHGVSVRSTVIVEGPGALTITLQDSAAGAFNFYPGGSITFWDTASSLIINGNTYALVNDLATLASDVSAYSSGFFALANDYDASGDGTYSDAVVMKPLIGTLEGLGHTISNVTIVTYGGFDVGLLAEIDGTARDLNLSGFSIECDPEINASDAAGLLAGVNSGLLKNISVSGGIDCPRAGAVGGLVGNSTSSGQITTVNAAASVSGYHVHNAGGVVGYNAGTITNASASGSISTGAFAGGLAGITGGLVQDSHATGHVSNINGYQVGGLAGVAGGSILRCFATGNVVGKKHVGGLVGSAGTLTIDSSFATGTASSAQQGGGLIGYANGTVTLINSYARGAATGIAAKVGYAGGLIGWFSRVGSVTASYSTGAPNGGKYTGGLVGDVDGSASMAQAYWDLDTSGVSNSGSGVGNKANYPGITGLTDAQLKFGLPAGFSAAIWGQSASINNGYPYLLANPPP